MADDRRSANRRTVLRTAGATLGTVALGGAAYTVGGRGTGDGSDSRSREQSATPWTEMYPGDHATGIVGTDDGGLVAVGATDAVDHDAWLFRVSAATGDTEWNRTFEAEDAAGAWPYTDAEALVRTDDGGFAVAATKRYEDGDNQPLLVTTDAEGKNAETTGYETDDADRGQGILQTEDGGYLLLGSEVAIRTAPSGQERWRTRLSDRTDHHVVLRAVVPAHDDGYVVAGTLHRPTECDEGNVFVVKLTDDGSIGWRNEIDLSAGDEANDIVRTESGYALAGRICTGGTEQYNGLLLHLTEQGEGDWYRSYGGGEDDQLYALTRTDDGGFFLGGRANSRENEYWLLKTTATGERQWSRAPVENGVAFGVAQTPAGEYVSAGLKKSWDLEPVLVNLGQPD
ncbi:hypothetical protein [Haloarchaeobius baliensis]|uniref:hypothetical protein n=1 Tax=Haloarchaeobius baliensis TaxID=1670458 RepID=UPI003F884561